MEGRGFDTGLGGPPAPGNNPPAGLNPSAPVFTPGGNPDPFPALPNLPGHGGSAGLGIPHPPEPSHRPIGDPPVPGLGLPEPMGSAESAKSADQKSSFKPEG